MSETKPSPDSWVQQARADLATLPAEQWVRLYGARLVAESEANLGSLRGAAKTMRAATASASAGWRLSERLSELLLGLFRELDWKPEAPWPGVTGKRWGACRRFVLEVLTARRQFLQAVAGTLGEPLRGIAPAKPGSGAELLDLAAKAVLAGEANPKLEKLFERVRERAAEIRAEVEEAVKVPENEVQ